MQHKTNFKKALTIIMHIAFWVVCFYLITRLFGVKNVEVYSNTTNINDNSEKVLITYDDNFKWAAAITLSFCALIFYLNVFLFLKSYFDRKNIFSYLSKFLGVAIACIAFDFTVNTVFNYRLPFENNWLNFPFAGLHLGLFVFYMVISFAYAFIFEWYKNEKLRNTIKQEKLSTELNFLKSQINPHFLFNTLNNLFSIAQKNNVNELSTGINQLSNLMRYMLYESNSNFVSLQKEVNYIESFIDIQKLRYDENDEVIINFEKKGSLQNTQIAPMILLPFVENAFKHGVSINESSIIHLFLEVVDNTILFTVKNNVYRKQGSINESSGIGLENVKRRLDLIYPNKHSLTIQNENSLYAIELKINNE